VTGTLLIGLLAPLLLAPVASADWPDDPLSQLKISPSDQANNVRPDRPIVVRSADGPLTSVKGAPGTFSADHRTWTSRTLKPDSSYTVVATSKGMVSARAISRFSTLKPAHTLRIAQITPAKNEKVGVGMPIIVTFNRPVRYQAAVSRALHVSARQPGAWRWLNPRQAVYRTRDFWQAGQRVTLDARLQGVRAARTTYGTADRTTGFTVGRALVTTINVRRHVMVVRQNGEVLRKVPISAGGQGHTTTSGTHLTMAKTNPEEMISPGKAPGDPGYYDLRVNYAVRISSSGEYVHSAPWSVGSQGRRNVSHGCVNASPSDARWFYGRTLRGDVVKISGTDRPLRWQNGWGFWQLPWRGWIAS
jgi:lipoprotein-anchoring transpeptidase ErfK/SrfK